MSSEMLNRVCRTLHIKCRNGHYPRCSVPVIRTMVLDDFVSWDVLCESYKPVEYTDKAIQGQPWSDPVDTSNIKWNDVDDGVDRKSHEGLYTIVADRPINPRGRTGLAGRGCLGRWGPNHAADPIVTRWKPGADRVLQFVAIQRRDCGEWAIPGGMVDPGEVVTATLKREFMEEALNSLELKAGEVAQTVIDNIFSNGTEVYRGYVDDPRNTDNAWMETVAMNFHDDTGETAGRLTLQAGDDASKVRWMDIDSGVKLYASHADFLHRVVIQHKGKYADG